MARASTTFTDEDQKNLEKVSRILAKAEGTDNEHERDTFLAAAQTFATRYGIDLAMARSHYKGEEEQRSSTITVIKYEVGVPGDRAGGTLADLLCLIGESQDLMWIRGNSNGWVELYGPEFAIKFAHAVYMVVAPQMIQEMTEWLDSGEWRDERGVTKASARKSFAYAYRVRIKQRLEEAKQKAEWEAKREHGRGAEVALVDQKRETRSFFYGNTSVRSVYRPDAGNSRRGYGRGAEAGDRANLHDSAPVNARGRLTS